MSERDEAPETNGGVPFLRRPQLLPAAASVGAFLMITWAMVGALEVRRTMPVVRAQSSTLQELVGRMERLDEAATGAVRLAAVGAGPEWEVRYRALEAELLAVNDSLVRVADALRPGWRDALPAAPEGAGVGSIPALNERAVALARAGERSAAQALLDGPEYALAKSSYEARKDALLGEVGAVVAEAEARTDAVLRGIVVATSAAFVLLMAVWGVIVSAREAREQRRLAARLRQSEARLRAIVDVAPVAIVRVDREHRVQFWNAAAERMFGWTADEVLGQPYPLGAGADPEEVTELFERGFAGSMEDGVELRRRRKDGRLVDVRMWNAAIRDESGEIVGLVGVLADVTEQRGLEARLRQAQKLEAVGRLAGGIAHDFNNVLTAVRGHAELLLDRLEAGDDARPDVEEIHKSASRATQLTRQLLAFSRQQVLQPRVLDLAAVVADTEGLLRRLIGEHIRLELTVAPELGRVEADPSQVEQVLMNLAVNARDAMPDGGELTLELDDAELTHEFAREFPYEVIPGPYVRLTVTDTGAGMDADTRDRAFEPFFTTKPTGQGTGLGLATVFGIVKQSGGYIWVDSEPGQGSRFQVFLPRVDKPLPDPATGAGPADSETGGRETVLLVEDDHAVRALVRRVLERGGYRVLEAAGPSEALLSIIPGHGDQPIDLLLTDVVMPDMSGPELAERVALAYPGIRTIFMSGYARDEATRHGMVTGPNTFLQKPFGPPELARSVRQTLDGA